MTVHIWKHYNETVPPPELLESLFEDHESHNEAYTSIDEWRTQLGDEVKYRGVEVVDYRVASIALLRRIFKLNGNVDVHLGRDYVGLLPNINTGTVETTLLGYHESLITRLKRELKPLNFIRRSTRAPSYSHLFHDLKAKHPLVVFAVSSSGEYVEGFSKSAYPIMRECHRQGIDTLAIVNTPELKVKFEDRQFTAIVAPTITSFPYGVPFLLKYESIKHHINSVLTQDVLKNYERDIFLRNLVGTCLITFNYTAFFHELYEHFNPSLIFTIPDKHAYLGEIAVQVARNHQIPSMTTLGVVIVDHPNYGQLMADRLLATGEAMKNVYVRKGVRSERIIVVGNPALDSVYSRNLERDRIVAAKCGVPAQKRIVVYATDALYVDETNKTIRAVNEVVQQFTDTVLVVKVHPREPIEPYLANSKAIVLRDIPLYPLLNCCELLVTGRSNVALEALALGKQIITVNLSGRKDVVPYAANGILSAHTLPEVAELTRKCLSENVLWSRGVAEFVDSNLYRLDGKSAERAVIAIKEAMLK